MSSRPASLFPGASLACWESNLSAVGTLSHQQVGMNRKPQHSRTECRVNDLETLSPSLRVQGTIRKRQKECKNLRDGGHQGYKVSKHSVTGGHRNSDWQHAWDLLGLSAKGKWTSAPSLPQKPSPIDNHSQMSFLSWSLAGIQTTF